MTTATCTPAENARPLGDLARKLPHAGILPDEQIDRLDALATRQAERDPAYVNYVNAKVRAALANPGRTVTSAEMREKIKSW